jgi:hypothetical protein
MGTTNHPPYDQWRRAHPGTGTFQLVEWAIELTADLRTRSNDGRPPKRKRKAADQEMYEALVNALVSALVHRELAKKGGWTQVPLSHSRLGTLPRGKGGRYRSLAMSRSLPQVVDLLAVRNWLILKRGTPGTKERIQSTMRATRALVQQMEAYGCKLSDFAIDPAQELIILKGRKPVGRDGRGRSLPAPWLDYVDTRETLRMRAEMQQLNAWLAIVDLDYMMPDQGVDHVGGRTLRRIFNNGTFDEGGRMTGGFWIETTMKPRTTRPWRGHIRISGEPVVVVDFNSMFLRLLYAEAGVQAPAGDLYADIEGLTADGAPHREGAKKLISAMYFKSGDVGRKPKGSRIFLPKKLHVRKLVANIKRRHAPVAHLFGGNIGFRLFRRESDIMLETLRQCREEGLVALPIHDAVLIAESRADDAKRIMLSAFERVTGFKAEVGKPKRPDEAAEELDTEYAPEDVKQPEDDPYRWDNIVAIEKEGERWLAEIMAKEFEADRPITHSPDADGDWV